MHSYVANPIFEGTGGRKSSSICQLTDKEVEVAKRLGFTIRRAVRHIQPERDVRRKGKKKIVENLPPYYQWPTRRIAFIEVQDKDESRRIMKQIRSAF